MVRSILTQTEPKTTPIGTTDFHRDGVQLPGVDLVTEAPEPPERKAGGPLDRHLWAVGFAQLHRLKPPDRIVLDGMADHANSQGVFHLYMETLATYCGLSRKGVLDISARLHTLGAVETLSSGRHTRSQSIYQLTGGLTGWTINGEKPEPLKGAWRDRLRVKRDVTPGDISEGEIPPGPTIDVTGSDIYRLEDVTPGVISSSQMSPGQTTDVTPGDILQPADVTRSEKTTAEMSPGVTYNPVGYVNPTGNDINPDNDNPNHNSPSSLSSSTFPQKAEEIENFQDCSNCEAPKFRDHEMCIPHLVTLFWPHLGSTWQKGRRSATRWYTAHPDDFEDQISELGHAVLANPSNVEVDEEEFSAPPAPPPDLGGGTFRCNQCGLTEEFGVAFDGTLHRDYSERDSDGSIVRFRCGGTWERITERAEECDGAATSL